MQLELLNNKRREINLRDYQASAKEKILNCLRMSKNTLFYLPTGGGKTEVAAAIVLKYLTLNKRSVIIANRIDLIFQIKKRLASYGIDCGVIWRKEELEPDKLVQIASIDSIKSDQLHFLKQFNPDLVVIDEVHNHLNKRAYPIYQLFQNKGILLGLSATPWVTGRFNKLDEWEEFWLGNKNKPIWKDYDLVSHTGTFTYRNFFLKTLGYVFDEIVTEVSAETLKELGFLVPVDLYNFDETKNLHKTLKVDSETGDFNAIEMERVLMDDRLISHIVEEYTNKGKNKDGSFKRGIIFPSGVNHSLKLCDALRKKGFKVAHIEGSTPAKLRQEIYAQLELNQLNLISSCDCFSEGFDLPAIEIALHCRPTKSLARYIQQVGRVLRISPRTGKEKAIILDQGDNSRSIISDITEGTGFHPYDHLFLTHEKILKIEEPGLPDEFLDDYQIEEDEEELKKRTKTCSPVELTEGKLFAPRNVRKTRQLIEAWQQRKILSEAALIELFLFNIELPSCQAVEELGIALGKDIKWMEQIYGEAQFIFYSCQGLKVSNFNCPPQRVQAIKRDISIFYKKLQKLLIKFAITPDFEPPNNNFLDQLNQARIQDPKAAYALYKTLVLGLSIPEEGKMISEKNKLKLNCLHKAWDYLSKKYKRVESTLTTRL